MVDEQRISLQEAADQLGVHYMTAYRYVRTGKLPGTRLGGQWQIDPRDLASLKDSPAKAQPGRSPKGARAWPKRFENQLVSGDEAGAWTVVQDALSAGLEPVEVLELMLIPAMKSIGTRWANGKLSVAQEHQASAIAQRVVGRLGPKFAQRGRKRGLIVVGSPPGEHHSLPNAIVADLLRVRRFLVSDLGANVPIESFVDFVSSTSDLVAVGVGVTMPGNDANTRNLLEALRAAVEVPLVLGGAAVPDSDSALGLGADVWSGPGIEGLERYEQLPKPA
jgi:excisionase family DNA binding protein